MTKPRRQSALANRNPVAPPPGTSQQPPVEAAENYPEADETASAAKEAATSEGQGQASPKPKKKKVSFYQLPAEEARAKAAWAFTMGHTGHRTVTSFYEEAVSSYTRELEAKYNDSKPFG